MHPTTCNYSRLLGDNIYICILADAQCCITKCPFELILNKIDNIDKDIKDLKELLHLVLNIADNND